MKTKTALIAAMLLWTPILAGAGEAKKPKPAKPPTKPAPNSDPCANDRAIQKCQSGERAVCTSWPDNKFGQICICSCEAPG